MRNFLADFAFSVRMLRKSPVFAITILLVVALATGANSAVFSIFDAVLLGALPFRDPTRLVMIWEKNPALGSSIRERGCSLRVAGLARSTNKTG